MTNWKRRQKRKEAVKRRAAEPSTMFKNCRVVGCKNPARAATEDGLDTRFCRVHAEHYARHGSPYRTSYTAAELNPYRRAALEWLMAHEDDRLVANTIQRVRGLYDRAGPHVEPFRLRGLSPQDRARAAWARLRHHRVDPRIAVAVWLAVEMKAVDGGDGKTEFKRVQAAKVVHRLASGSHKRWEYAPGGPTERHTYPASRGRVLRHVGAGLEKAVELLAERAVMAMLAFKREWDQQKQGKDGRAVSRRMATRQRPRKPSPAHHASVEPKSLVTKWIKC